MSKIAENVSQKIDQAIENAQPFAGPILNHLRKLIHNTDNRLQEDWKWGPCFHYKGNVIGLWGHKKHVNMIFWKGAGMKDRHGLFVDADSPKALRTIKFTELESIDDRILSEYILEAVELMENETEVKPERVPIRMPDLLLTELEKDADLKAYFDSLPYYKRKEFAHHIGDAKQQATKERRLKKVLEKLRDGEGLNDKYR